MLVEPHLTSSILTFAETHSDEHCGKGSKTDMENVNLATGGGDSPHRASILFVVFFGRFSCGNGSLP
jgi:hypothetical protein